MQDIISEIQQTLIESRKRMCFEADELEVGDPLFEKLRNSILLIDKLVFIFAQRGH